MLKQQLRRRGLDWTWLARRYLLRNVKHCFAVYNRTLDKLLKRIKKHLKFRPLG